MNRDWVDKDFYKVLGVGREADQDQIKRAYRKLAQKHHPDANLGNKEAEDKFKDISEAYATLSDPEQRKEYDEVRTMVDSGGFRGFGGSGAYAGGQGSVSRICPTSSVGSAVGDLFGGSTEPYLSPAAGCRRRPLSCTSPSTKRCAGSTPRSRCVARPPAADVTGRAPSRGRR